VQETPLATSTPLGPVETTAAAAAPLSHSIYPGEMPTIASTIDDTLYNSDNYNTCLFERPFASGTMEYRPDLDLQKIYMGSDNNFFYFELDLFNVNPTSNGLVANYGAEIDVDRDGRGDFLVWVYQAPTSTNWDTTGIAVFADQNNDVGGATPLISDAPNTGNGYETELWPGKPTTDADGAWVRVNPSSPKSIQFTVKRSLLGNPTSFMWEGWADDGIKAPYSFDYNDLIPFQQAGSPYQGNAYYPLAKVAFIDNTCREAWGFTPVGTEPGLCVKVVTPTKGPSVAKPTNTPTLKPTYIITKPVVKTTTAPVCTDVQIGAQVTDGSTWDPAWASGVTLCLDGGDCQNPDSSGYAFWYRPAGGYTITAYSKAYGITPGSASVKLGCGQKSLTQFVIGPG